jgi:ribose 5-phosphate isomerase B
MKIAIGSDHAGFALKERLRLLLAEHEVVDCGTLSEASCDYPDIAERVARAVAAGEVATGILVCGTGVGMAIAANKVAGIRAVACSETYTARLTREHNDANILCLGARVVGDGVAEDLVRVWLATPFSEGGRHVGRLNKIAALEAGGKVG